MEDFWGTDLASSKGIDSHIFTDHGDWRKAPVLIGTTKFEPHPDTKNIMITGGEGFIASWLVRHLTINYDYNIVSFDKLDYCSSLNNTRMLGNCSNFTFYHGDITNAGDVLRCLKKHNIDTVIHFAAQSHVDLSFGNSLNFSKNNVVGTHNLLECVKTHGQKNKINRFIHVSTDEVYGEVEDGAEDLVEEALLAPTNPYAATKAAAEMLVMAYAQSFKLPIITVRSNNIYGPHQFPEKIIPKFTHLLMRRQQLIIHGNGLHSRRYLYAQDSADAFDTVLHKGTIGQVYNVSSADEINNLQVCSKLLKMFGLSESEDWIRYTQDRPFNDRRYAVNGTKLMSLGWKQKVRFDEGLERTVAWYRAFPGWWGDISDILTPFPVVAGRSVVATEQPPQESPASCGGLQNGHGNTIKTGKDGMQGTDKGEEQNGVRHLGLTGMMKLVSPTI